mgnify:CR=1 FL=1
MIIITKMGTKKEFTLDIDLARLGPMSVKYLQNLSAISIGSVNFLPSDLNDVGRDELLLR